MESILSFFETNPLWLKSLWVILCITVFWFFEHSFSLFKFQYKKWKHAKTNFLFLASVLIINALFGVLLTLVFIWLKKSNFGMLQLFEAPVWVKLTFSIVVLDLIAQYMTHYILHKVKWMWRLHIVHHSDKNVDVTSGTRHHPLDFIFRELMALGTVVILGMPISFYFLYRIISILFTYFNHANMALPLWLDKGLSYIIVSPNMHKFHNHFQLPWTDSNYGSILSIWDRMFGTFRYGNPKEIQYGLDISDYMDDENFLTQLKIPFNKTLQSKK